MTRSGVLPRLGLLVGLMLAGLGGCRLPVAGPKLADEPQIRERIASIRAAILAKDAAGIVRDGTDDWSFTGPDGKIYDRASYLVRTTALLAKVVEIESLETQVDRIAVAGDRADVEITQRMVRRERDGAGGGELRLALTYREAHRWVRTPGGWRVQRVAFVGMPERRVLPPHAAP